MEKEKKHGADKWLQIVAYVVTIGFVVLLLYPLLYTISNSAKDNVKIYDMPPSILPDRAQSMTVVVDYSKLGSVSEQDLLDAAMRDNALAMFSTGYELPRESIFEIQFYGVKDNKTVFYSRAHKMKLELIRDFGVYQGSVVKSDVLLHGDRYVRANNTIGYKFDPNGLDNKPKLSSLNDKYTTTLSGLFSEIYDLNGELTSTGVKTKNMLLLESFVYYLQMPSYVYSQNETIAEYGFLTFIFNTVVVIGWAIISQVFLCSISAFAISRLLSPKAGRYVLLYFLGAMMIPFASIMLPQLIMYKSMGSYNNYAALLLPFLYPFGFYVYLFKGFFDRIPNDYFEAARIDGASSFFLYAKIMMPLSKPIISLIALQTFIGNWNDFFWAWMVTENQSLWTLNVALYNLSMNGNTKQNFILGLSLVMIVPVILATALSSKQLKQSIMSSGVKG
ncbi:carbohydrate ABC transporter permease [Paenibacillus sp. LHD-117]|uniref:carbohydrate ABC transporter permease n=1 Tax=Paenibacillus sp. LHD-117 TaxID=3071412 RepID=UPI0027DFBC70|nr:carbohydrate ABC transporter permease [Paenibacillus sp. LHD-117]MDQ6422987.1 carbohydrate ABC transporter permease [Paenibacillus sp. LHD-117]